MKDRIIKSLAVMNELNEALEELLALLSPTLDFFAGASTGDELAGHFPLLCSFLCTSTRGELRTAGSLLVNN